MLVWCVATMIMGCQIRPAENVILKDLDSQSSKPGTSPLLNLLDDISGERDDSYREVFTCHARMTIKVLHFDQLD